MKTYLLLLRGINVGGKNKIAMAELKRHLEEAGFMNVITYIQSGNVIVQSTLDAAGVCKAVESLLPQKFTLDSELIKILVLTRGQLQAIVDDKPAGFGDHPETYHSDVIFLMGITTSEALPVFKPREGVDTIWTGHVVIYSQRVSALRTKSRLSAIIGTPLYKSMTIRSWNTTIKLLQLLREIDAE